MTTRSIATALALGFLAFTLSTYPAVARDCRTDCGKFCPAGYESVQRLKNNLDCPFSGGHSIMCCKPEPVTKTAPVGGDFEARFECEKNKDHQYDPATGRCVNLLKKTKPPATAEAAEACRNQGNQYNYETGRCVKLLKKTKPPATAEAAEACRNEGNDYNHETGRCVKVLKKPKPQGAPEQAEEQSSSEQTSDDDSQPRKKNKKKKKHYDD